MKLTRLWLHDFRSYDSLNLELHPGFTALIGSNGIGKTNIVEAISLLSTLKSFRGAPTESVIRRGATSAVIRAEGIRDGREVLIELQLGGGKSRAQVNRQKLQRSKDLLGALRVTVFGPDDLALIKEGPSIRRNYLDDLLVTLDPAADRLVSDMAKILKQRSALLRSSRGKLDESASVTLDVWDTKLADRGTLLTNKRQELLDDLVGLTTSSFEVLAGQRTDIGLVYQRSWSQPTLIEALTEARDHDVKRSVTSVGPHRDDVILTIDGFASRTQASQGEQRTLALALRLAGHRLITDRLGEPPLLLLDDVLSELDPHRAARLFEHVPDGQTILTSASELPPETNPDRVLRLDAQLPPAEGEQRLTS